MPLFHCQRTLLTLHNVCLGEREREKKGGKDIKNSQVLNTPHLHKSLRLNGADGVLAQIPVESLNRGGCQP